MTNSSPERRARVSPGRSAAGDPLGDGDEELVADAVTVGVVDGLEPVEVGEEDGDRIARPAAAEQGVVEPFHEQQARFGRPVRASWSASFAGPGGGVLEIGAGLGVEQVGGGDIGQGLGRFHRFGVAAPGVCRDTGRGRRTPSAPPWRSGKVNTAASPASRPGPKLRESVSWFAGRRPSTASPVLTAARHGPSPARSAARSKRRADSSEAAT